ncbi:MAG: hypothetical protein HY304_04850, partial [candidate division Zixibacteria bacterium]|nr:hypothetical protein [candidate division Zixibacteria bacterium]
MSTKPQQKSQSRHAPAARAGSPLRGNTILFLGIAIALGLFAIQARQLWFTQDDAYISYRYARNALDGQGLVFNTGERVEGYTNFLWVIWLIAAGRLGVGFDLAAKVLGILSAAGMIVLAALLCRRAWEAVSHSPGHWAGAAGAILLGVNGSFAYWSISGL